MTHPDLDPWAGTQPREQPTDFRLDQRIEAQDALAHEQDEKIHWLEAQIKDLQEKLISYDVRIKVLESLDAQADTDEFAYFWKQYPRKVGKGHARKAFEKACKKASFDTIMDGLNRYKKDKPDETPWKHPQTWLNSEGWDDNWTGELDAQREPEANTDGRNTLPAVGALISLMGSVTDMAVGVQATAIRKAFCAKRDRDLHILAACSDNIPEVKRFMPMLSDKTDHDVKRQQATIRTQLDAISMDLGYGPIQWPRSQ